MDRLLSENEVVGYLSKWLKKEGWAIKSSALGYARGIDIIAYKGEETLLVEAKGARANIIKKRKSFNSNQIKVHFGRALIKAMEEKTKNPDAIVAIAQPDTELIRKTLQYCLPQVKKLGIILYWINTGGSVIFNK